MTHTTTPALSGEELDLDKLAHYDYVPGPAGRMVIGQDDNGCYLLRADVESALDQARAARQAQPVDAGVQADDLAAMEARKDAAYLERNQVVAALAKCFPSGVAETAIEGWSEDWHGCVYIDLPTGQVSWHFHDSQAYLFDGLPQYTGKWDGHDTPEKYRRVAALAQAAPACTDHCCDPAALAVAEAHDAAQAAPADLTGEWNAALEAAAKAMDPFDEEGTLGSMNARIIRDLKRTARAAVVAIPAPAERNEVSSLSYALNHAREALRFYADQCHFQMHQPDEWDTVSGEPQNFYEDSNNTATVEDGSVAKQALEDIAGAERYATIAAPTAQSQPAGAPSAEFVPQYDSVTDHRGRVIGVRMTNADQMPAAVAAQPAGAPTFDECVASGQSCSYGPEGRKGEMQCRYCGKAQPAGAGAPSDATEAAELQTLLMSRFADCRPPYPAGLFAWAAAALARQGAAPAQAEPLGWKVRERRDAEGELLDCFVEGPKGDMPYGLEVLGDDYNGFGGVQRKLEHCQMIVVWANGDRATAPAHAGVAQAARDVLAERQRQVDVEGWTPAHDDEHAQGQMAQAAACYAAQGDLQFPENWPWGMTWWKPQGTRRNLVKAGALVLAEIERLDRATAVKETGDA